MSLVAGNGTQQIPSWIRRSLVPILLLITALVVVLGSLMARSFLKNYDPTEIDVKKLAFAPKRNVEQMFGVPFRYERCCKTDNEPPVDIAHYKWGDVLYTEGGTVADVDYRYKDHPYSIELALAKVGLEKTSEPLRVGHLYNWCPGCVPSSPALLNDNLELEVHIFDDAKGDGFDMISISFPQSDTEKYPNRRSSKQ